MRSTPFTLGKETCAVKVDRSFYATYYYRADLQPIFLEYPAIKFLMLEMTNQQAPIKGFYCAASVISNMRKANMRWRFPLGIGGN